MTIDDDTRFWDKSAESYSKSAVSDEAGYQRTLDRTLAFLKPADRVLELGCGTGSTALRLASHVQTYLATDISPAMIQIANSKLASHEPPLTGISFRTATVEALLAAQEGDKTTTERFNAVLGFNCLHLVRDLPATLRGIHALLEDGGLLITKTPCVGEMNVLIRLALPVMRAVGRAPYAAAFRASELSARMREQGFEVVETEVHASKGNDNRPYIVARKT